MLQKHGLICSHSLSLIDLVSKEESYNIVLFKFSHCILVSIKYSLLISKLIKLNIWFFKSSPMCKFWICYVTLHWYF